MWHNAPSPDFDSIFPHNTLLRNLWQNRPQLSPAELAAFRDWFAEFDAAAWDQQFEADVAAGRLDVLAEKALQDLREGRCTESVRHRATPDFWYCYRRLPSNVQELADRYYDLLKQNPRYPSLHFQRVGQFCSVRIGLHYRVLGVEQGSDLAWLRIGSHAKYDKLLGRW